VITYIFKVTPEKVIPLFEVESTTKHKLRSRSIDTVGIAAENFSEATLAAEKIRESRLQFMEKIRDNPINGIGQRG
jgi:hypothetical protein